MGNKDYIETVAESIIRQLKEGTAPWIKPWEPGQHFKPYNPSTGNEYKGINALWLMSVAESKGYQDTRWMTFKQSNNLDAQVMKGEKSTSIQYWKWSEEQVKRDEAGEPVLDENGQTVKVTVALSQPKVFFANVFNAEQLNGLPPQASYRLQLSEFERSEQAETLLRDSGVAILYQNGNRAFYRPSTDTITLPQREQFKSLDGFYATALHELGHATGHESRLNRDLAHPFGSEGYAKEELRAEIASLMLGEKLEIGHDPSQHVAYIASWIRILENDPREIFRAASDSEKILQYLTGPELKQTVIQEQEALPITVQMPTLQAEVETQMNVSNERVYLAVPYAEKEEAKALGARWDKEAGSWYAPPGTDLSQLEPWIPKPSEHLHVQDGPNPQEAFAEALSECGLQLTGLPVMNGQIQRVPVQGEDPSKKSGSYVGHLDGHPAGYIQNFKTGEQTNWKLNVQLKALSAVDRAKLAAEAAQKRQDRANQMERQHTETAKMVEAHFSQSVTADQHPYLQSKGVSAYGLKLDAVGTILLPKDDPEGQQWSQVGNLLVPIRDIDGQFLGAQSIDGIGRKSLPRGCRKQGGHHVIGDVAASDKILFAEGYATAATLHELTRLPVVVTFDSGNLPGVAEAYRAKFPEKNLILAGDNDHHKPMEKNGGLQKAEEAAKKVGGYTLLPSFEKGASGSDWNDLMHSKGKTVVSEILKSGIAMADIKHRANMALVQEKAQEKEKAVQGLEKSLEQGMGLSLSR
jgi:putative DNA primase/helicase